MDAYTKRVRADFDRLAVLDREGWNHNLHYHDFLLAQLPRPCRRALDVGCGTGSFTARLAEHAEHVTGIDLSPKMIARARRRLPDPAHVALEVADARTHALPPGHFDFVASLTTLHHLPLEATLARLAETLRPRGVLAVLDIPAETRLLDYALAAVAAPVNLALMRRHLGRWRRDRAVVEAWLEHGSSDVYPPLGEVRAACRAVLPGASVRRHLLWRYSIVWRKGQADASYASSSTSIGSAGSRDHSSSPPS